MLRSIVCVQRARISTTTFLTRKMSSSTPDALVLPVFSNEFPVVPGQFQSSLNAQALWTSTHAKSDKALERRLFHQETGPSLSLVALGKGGTNENARREAARRAIATGVKAARDAGARTIGVVSDKISAHDAGEWHLPRVDRADILIFRQPWPRILLPSNSPSKQRPKTLFLPWNALWRLLSQDPNSIGALDHCMRRVRIWLGRYVGIRSTCNDLHQISLWK